MVADVGRPTITIAWTCFQCQRSRVRLDVPARLPDQDVAEWVTEAATLAFRDHALTSPGCEVEQFGELLIPIDPGVRIGEPVPA